MHQSFYQFVKRFENHGANDPMSRLANQVSRDPAFPKQAASFDELASYVEHSSDYSRLVTVFDTAWQKYQSEN